MAVALNLENWSYGLGSPEKVMTCRLAGMVLCAALLTGCKPSGPPETSAQPDAAASAAAPLSASGEGRTSVAADAVSASQQQFVTVTYPNGEAVAVSLRPIVTAGATAMVRTDILSAGFTCSEVSSVGLLVQGTTALPIAKADCVDGHAYQVTMASDKEMIKPWTGNLTGK